MVGTIIRHPGLWAEAFRAARSSAAGRGLVPDHDYLGWRAETAYGSADATTSPHDLVEFLRWRRRQRALRR